MERHIKLERHLKHPPERVWEALTNPKALAQWFAKNDFKPEVGHRFHFNTEDTGPGYDGYLYCEVIYVEAPRKLAYTFKGGSMSSDTVVTWVLEPQADGTLLKLEHTGFKGFKDSLISFIIGYGWGKYMRTMPAVLTELASNETSISA